MASRTKRDEIAVLICGLLLGVLACLAYEPATRPILPKDNQHYFFMAERVAAGVPPHVSAFDPKSSVPSLLGGAAIRAGDLVGVAPAYSARVLSVLAFGVFVAAIGLLVYRETDSRWAALFSILASISFAQAVEMAATGNRPKIFIMLFIALSLVSVQQRRAFSAAFWSSLAMLSWQPAALALVAVFLCEATCRRNREWLIPFAAGVALPTLLYLAYFWSHDALEPLWNQTVKFPRGHFTHSFPGLRKSLRELAHLWLRGFGSWNYLYWFALSGLAAWLLLVIRNPRRAARQWVDRPQRAALALMAVLLSAFTLWDHQGVVDLFVLLPFVAIFASFALVWLTAGLDRWLGSKRLPQVLVALAMVWLAIDGWADRTRPRFSLQDQMALGEKVRLHIAAGESVYAINSAHLLGFARADNWLVYSSIFRRLDRYLMRRSGSRAFVPTIDGHLPTMVLKGKRARISTWGRWLPKFYERVDAPEFKAQGIAVWVLKDREGVGT